MKFQPRSRRVSDEMDLSQEIGENSDVSEDEDDHPMFTTGKGEVQEEGDEKWRKREDEQNRVYRVYQERMAANAASVSG